MARTTGQLGIVLATLWLPGCAPELVVVPATLELEDPPIGVSTEGQVTLQNIGSRRVSALRLVVDAPFEASIDQDELAAGEVLDISVSITPEAEGDYASTLRVRTDDDDAALARVALSAVVQAPSLELGSDDPVCEAAGQDGVLRVDLMNAGPGPLVITGAELLDDADGGFWLLDPHQPVTVAAGARSWLDLGCDPDGPRSGLMSLETNDPEQPSVELALHPQALWIEVSSPDDQEVWSTDDSQVFSATVHHAGGIDTAYVSWSSDLGETIVSGAVPTGQPFGPPDPGLLPGSHDLQLYASTSDGATALDERRLHISTPPSAAITRPEPGTLVQQDTRYFFSGTVGDADEASEGLAVSWSSDLAGELPLYSVDKDGHTATDVVILDPGPHTITLEVEDEHGLTASATSDYTVNAAPTAAITSPSHGSVQQDELTLVAAISDEEDSASSLSCTWSSEVDGDLGTVHGSSDGTCTLTVAATLGDQTVGLLVEDSMGGSTTAVVSAFLDGPPELSVLSPTINSWRPLGGSMAITGIATDVADAATDLTITWSSDVDGPLGTTTPASSGLWQGELSGLSVGRHIITVSATDTVGSSTSQPTEIEILDCADTTDHDGDGFSTATGDCDEANPWAYPGAAADLGDPRGACLAADIVTIRGESEDDGLGLETNGGDLDGDGLDDIVIGAYVHDNSAGDNVGAVFLLTAERLAAGGTMTTSDLAVIEGTTNTEYLGYDVAVLPDVDGDGLEDLVMSNLQGTGSVHLFYGRSSWSGTDADSADQTITGNPLIGSFGSDIDSADFDGDGLADLVIGAAGSDVVATDGGSVHIFSATTIVAGASASSDCDVVVVGRSADSELGAAVASAGDMDGDGLPDLLVSSPEDDLIHSNSGSVRLYTDVASNILTGEAALSTGAFVGETQNSYLGDDDLVGGVGDVNGDSFDDIVIVASGYDSAFQTDAGKAYLWLGGTELVGMVEASENAYAIIGNSNDAFLGDSIHAAGDLDSDGLADFLLGAHKDDTPHSNAGRIGLWLGADMDDWTTRTPFNDADTLLDGLNSSDYAGRSVVGDLDTDGEGPPDFAISAAGEGDGAVYVYRNHGQSCTAE